MGDFAKWVGAATLSASALTGIGAGTAAAADVPVPYGEPRYSQPQYQPPYNQPRYRQPRYGQPQQLPPESYLAPEDDDYRDAPPPAYVYRNAPQAYVYPPPPVYRYYEGPPLVAVLPPPVPPYYAYRRHRDFPRYEPHIARGPYERPWGYRQW